MEKGEEHQNTEEHMGTQELLNTMVTSQIQLKEDMNLMVQQFQNIKNSQGDNTDQTSPILESENDARHNLLFNYCNLLFLVFLCKKRYFRFRLFISLFLGAFNAF